MNLDLFNNLINHVKENDFIQNFIKELGNYLENNISEKEKIDNLSILDEIQNKTNITSEYRDKMSLERRKILEEYANKTQDKGTMYYIYDKSNNNYLLTICDKGKSNEVVKVEKNELPKEAGIDSILRKENGKYKIDKEATKNIKEEIKEKFNELLQEQAQEMKKRRIEGHLYEFVEKTGNSIWLIDNNKNDGKVFQEFEFLENNFKDAKEGDIFIYSKGKYIKYK